MAMVALFMNTTVLFRSHSSAEHDDTQLSAPLRVQRRQKSV